MMDKRENGIMQRPVALVLVLLLVAGTASLLAAAKNHDVENSDIIYVIPMDAIPAIDNPQWDDGEWLDPDDKVIVHWLENGSAKAYPLAILNWHEIANDMVDGRALAITWCPLCGTSISWNRTIDGNVTTFGVSGKLYQNTMVMYDRETESLWSQHTGVALEGVHVGDHLQWESNLLTTAGWIRQQTDEVLFLARPTTNGNFDRDYGMNPYPSYESSPDIWFPVGDVAPGTLPPKEWVIGYLPEGSDPVALPRDELMENIPTLLPYGNDSALALMHMGDVRIYRWNNSTTAQVQGDTLLTDDGAWSVGNGSVLAGDLDPLVVVPFVRNFWFGWYDFHPDTLLFQGPWTPPLELGVPPDIPPEVPPDDTENETAPPVEDNNSELVQPPDDQDLPAPRLTVELTAQDGGFQVRTHGDHSTLSLELRRADDTLLLSDEGTPVGEQTGFDLDNVEWVVTPTVEEQVGLARNLTIVDFAASWCSFCSLQFDVLDDWQAENSGYNVVTVWADAGETNESWAQAGFDKLVDWPVINDNASLYRHLGSIPLPAVALLDSDGRLLDLHVGLASEEVLTKLATSEGSSVAGHIHDWNISSEQVEAANGGTLDILSAGEVLQSLPIGLFSQVEDTETVTNDGTETTSNGGDISSEKASEPGDYWVAFFALLALLTVLFLLTKFAGVDELSSDPDFLAGDRDSPIGDQDSLAVDRDSPFGDRDSPFGDRDSPIGDQDSLAGDPDFLAGDRDSPIGDQDSPVSDPDFLAGDRDSPFGDQDSLAGEMEENEGLLTNENQAPA